MIVVNIEKACEVNTGRSSLNLIRLKISITRVVKKETDSRSGLRPPVLLAISNWACNVQFAERKSSTRSLKRHLEVVILSEENCPSE